MSHQKNSSAMRPRSLSFAAFVLLLIAGGSANAQITKSGAGYLLRVKYTKGQVLKFSTLSTMSGAQGPKSAPVSVSLPISLSVTDVKNGLATTKLVVGPMRMGASEIQPAESTTMTINTRNQPSSDDARSLLGGELPQAAVKIGQTWSTSAAIPDMTGASRAMKATYRFNGLKTVNGKSMAMITYALSGATTGSGTLLLLASDGTLYSNDAKLSVPNGPSSKVLVTSKMKRV